MRDEIRDQTMIKMFHEGASLTSIAKAVGISKARASAILGYFGLSVRDRQDLDKQPIIGMIANYISGSPDASITGFYREHPDVRKLHNTYIKQELRRRRVRLNRSAILSTALKKRLRNGRIDLTYEFLYEEYIEKKKSQIQIALETGYEQTTISKWIITYGLNKKRRKNERTK